MAVRHCWLHHRIRVLRLSAEQATQNKPDADIAAIPETRFGHPDGGDHLQVLSDTEERGGHHRGGSIRGVPTFAQLCGRPILQGTEEGFWVTHNETVKIFKNSYKIFTKRMLY